jgi:hypothetical protein
MVKPAFENLKIDFWVHAGKLGVTQPSLCLFHKSPQVGTQLLDAIAELKDQVCPAHRTLTFAPCSQKTPLLKLKLMLVPESEDLKVMSIRQNADVATIEMTDVGHALLHDAIVSWLTGAEDFGVSTRRSSLKPRQFGKLDRESGELWFWGPGYAGP